MIDDWREQFRTGLANLSGQAVVSGAMQTDVFETAIEESNACELRTNGTPILQMMCRRALSMNRQMTGPPQVPEHAVVQNCSHEASSNNWVGGSISFKASDGIDIGQAEIISA